MPPKTRVKGRVRRRFVPWSSGARLAARLRLGAVKRRYNPTPTFTETFRMGTINGDSTGLTAGLLTTSMNSVPQWGDYQQLYNQYCIRSVQFMLVPAYDSYTAQGQPLGGPAWITAPRLVYAINDSAQQPAPTSEVDVLTDNGAKIRVLDKPIKIRCRPVAQLGLAASTGGFVSETKRNRWLSFQNPEILHSGVAYAVTQAIPSNLPDPNIPIATIYAKVTFSLRDPK